LLFRLQFIYEELGELLLAIRERDVVEIADALVDISYVTLGTAHVCNLPWSDLFDEIHKSNLMKERVLSKDQSKRRGEFDVVKPVFWRKPDLSSILIKYNQGHHDD